MPGRATVSNTEVDLQKGKILVDGFAPLKPNFAGVVADQPLALNVTAQQIDLSQFEPLAQKGTNITGTLDGRVGLVGNIDTPASAVCSRSRTARSKGRKRNRRSAICRRKWAFANRTVTLQNTHAVVGGGKISLDGSVSVPNLRDPANSATIAFDAISDNAVFDLPNLFKGRINGNLTVARAAFSDYKVGGRLAVTSARIATAGLLPKAQADAGSRLDAASRRFCSRCRRRNDVRIQGGPIDIGAKGDLQVAGTLGAPTVDGTLTSTGGTLSFYRTFRIQYPSTVSFSRTTASFRTSMRRRRLRSIIRKQTSPCT